VVPLRVASGIINKVLEPMAVGAAVVATSAAAVGLEIDPREVCLVADTPEEFGAAIARLHRDPELYARLTTAAYRYVRQHHSWPRLMTEYRRTIEDLASAGNVRAAHRTVPEPAPAPRATTGADRIADADG
jgi:glycosyltransferase involved in cell wall biosynthesis